jgi:serine/threonine protein kinase/Flp pilus assembly protein TadD
MIQVACQHCHTQFSVAGDASPTTCPHCHRPLPADDADGPPIDAAEDDALVADLRAAFGFAEGSDDLDARTVVHAPLSDVDRALGIDPVTPGGRLGDFQILSEIGRGGMGIVYRARQVSLGREVALKILPGYARRARAAVQRFRAEAQAAARLHHTNVVSVYAQGEHGGHYFYAMELIDGASLDAVIHSRPDLLSTARHARGSSSGWRIKTAPPAVPGPARVPPPEAVDTGTATRPPPRSLADFRHCAALLAGVADALAAAHDAGVIHRDVKPHNLLLGGDGQLHLTDFGLARLADAPQLTLSGEIMGTPAYLAPEQVRGKPDDIDHRTDIYALGVTLYEVITGEKPFEGENREQILSAICTREPHPPRQVIPQIPLELETICLRAIDKDPRRRHQSAAELAEDLRRFADGRPILSRRTTLAEKALKWVRRHKALTAAGAATAAAIALVAILAWNVSAARRQEARGLLTNAYEQMAYYDCNHPERVQPLIDRAAALGAPAVELHLVQALASLGATDPAEARRHLDAVLRRDPDNQLALTMQAWAATRAGDPVAANAALETADALGPPQSPDVWFFRGLALHREDPEAAIAAYRAACAARAGQNAFYPQATLHLARARNQQLYATRSLEPFSEAAASLQQLIEQQQYGIYPYYLLSISHRLAAEIYRGSEGTRGDALVAEHYAAALEWARRGQDVDPTNDRPVAAEAEALESMGRLAEARAARTRALELAERPPAQWENLHYRWRLNYWLGDYAAALDDLARCAAFDEESRFYRHVYPALVEAARGEMEVARAHARAIVDADPESGLATLWSATTMRLLGAAAEARELLIERSLEVSYRADLTPPENPEWFAVLYQVCIDDEDPERLEPLVDRVDAPWHLWGAASFHRAALVLARGDRERAETLLQRAVQAYDSEQRYTYHARVILEHLRQDPASPAAIPLEWKDVERGSDDAATTSATTDDGGRGKGE